jgi:hypothetical protein
MFFSPKLPPQRLQLAPGFDLILSRLKYERRLINPNPKWAEPRIIATRHTTWQVVFNSSLFGAFSDPDEGIANLDFQTHNASTVLSVA